MFIMSKLKGFGQAKTMVRPPTRNTLDLDDDEDYSNESSSDNGKNTCMPSTQHDRPFLLDFWACLFLPWK